MTNNCMLIYQFENNEHVDILKSAASELVETYTGLKCIDGLSHYEPVLMKMDLIEKMITDAKLIIVDISYRNPNVFLELGIAWTLKKSIIYLCSFTRFKEDWNNELPFDMRGKELLVFKNTNELKIKLGTYLFDCLFKTSFKTVSWISTFNFNHIISSRKLKFSFVDDEKRRNIKSEIWSDQPLHNYMIIRYHVKINKWSKNKNPDVRFLLSPNREGLPRIGVIFPWENYDIDKEKFECHIDLWKNNVKEQPDEDIRWQQVSVCKKQNNLPIEFDASFSFCYPNLIFESSLFENTINRLIVPIVQFNEAQYPSHYNQFIGFASHDEVEISEISIKEIFV